MDHFFKFYIIIAVLNAKNTIENCLTSILSQKYSQYKIIIVDGGSNDGTVEIIKKYQKNLEWWSSEPDNGIYDAWNKALPHIKDGWVLFLGADDVLRSPNVLTLAAESLKCLDSNTKIAYGKIALVDNHNQTLAIKGAPWSITGKHFTSTMTLPHQGVFHHSSVFQIFGCFNPQMKIAGDYDLLLRVLPTHPPFFIKNLVVTSWRSGGISFNVKTPLLVAREFSQARRMNGYDSFSIALTIFYIKAYILRGISLLCGYRFANWFAKIYRKVTMQW